MSRYHSRHVVYNSIRRGLSPLPVCCPPYQRSIHTFLYSSQITLPEIFIPPPPPITHNSPHIVIVHQHRTPHPEETTQPSSIHPSPAPLHTHTPSPPRKEPTACQSYRESQTRVVGSSQHHNNLRRRSRYLPRSPAHQQPLLVVQASLIAPAETTSQAHHVHSIHTACPSAPLFYHHDHRYHCHYHHDHHQHHYLH